jgi:hypothetical protein
MASIVCGSGSRNKPRRLRRKKVINQRQFPRSSPIGGAIYHGNQPMHYLIERSIARVQSLLPEFQAGE